MLSCLTGLHFLPSNNQFSFVPHCIQKLAPGGLLEEPQFGQFPCTGTCRAWRGCCDGCICGCAGAEPVLQLVCRLIISASTSSHFLKYPYCKFLFCIRSIRSWSNFPYNPFSGSKVLMVCSTVPFVVAILTRAEKFGRFTSRVATSF